MNGGKGIGCYLFSFKYLCTVVVILYILVDGDLLDSVLLILEEATEALIKLTCPRST